MRDERKDVPIYVGYARGLEHGSVGIDGELPRGSSRRGHESIQHEPFLLDAVPNLRVRGQNPPLAVRDRHRDHLARLRERRKPLASRALFGAKRGPAAEIPLPARGAVGGERHFDPPGMEPGDEARLHENLGSVAYSENRLAALRLDRDPVDRGELGGDRSGPDPVLKRESAGEDVRIELAPDRSRLVPADDARLEPDGLERARGLVLAVHTRQLEHGDVRHSHSAIGWCAPKWMRCSVSRSMSTRVCPPSKIRNRGSARVRPTMTASVSQRSKRFRSSVSRSLATSKRKPGASE